MQSCDYIIRFVPHYGYLPIVTVTRDDKTTREVFRGSFKPTPLDALAAISHIADQIAVNDPEFRELHETPGMACKKCGGEVEPERKCFAIPTCFKCLPPPRLETAP